MNRITAYIVMAGAMTFGAQVFADDATMTPEQTHQMMKDCMAKQKAQDSSHVQERPARGVQARDGHAQKRFQ